MHLLKRKLYQGRRHAFEKKEGRRGGGTLLNPVYQ